jgi:hypothetical protein
MKTLISPFSFVPLLDGHESMVRFQNKSLSNDKLDESDYDSDLDIKHLITKLEDFEITNDDTDVRNHFQLDPSVWATPIKPITPTKVPNQMFQNHHNNSDMTRKFQMIPPPGLASPSLSQQTNALQQLLGTVPPAANAPKILSLEEIERNMINQQHQKIMQEKLAAIQSKVQGVVQQPPLPPQAAPATTSQQQRKPPQQPGMIFPPSVGPPPPHMNINGPPPPFPPVPPHLQGPNLTKFNPLMNITNHPMMNNFHPNFSGHMRPPPLQQIPNPQMNRMPP